MKTRTATLAISAVMLACWAGASFACEKSKTSTASASKSAYACSGEKASAVTASNSAHCGAGKASAVTASSHCNAEKAAALTAAAHGKAGVVAVPAGSSCRANKSSMASKTGCEICDETAGCNEQLNMAGAVTQVVPLKNGVMFVYTADTDRHVAQVQTAVRHRNDLIIEVANAGAEAVLCPSCESMRGAMTSGKLKREVLNIEGGSLTMITSEDPAVIKAIQEISGVPATAKS